MDMQQVSNTIRALQSEVVSGQSGRIANSLAVPNINREVQDKRRPVNHVNVVSSSLSARTLVTGVAGNPYTITASLPVGFEFQRAVIDEYDARFYGLINVAIEKYNSNAGKGGVEVTNPGPLSMLHAILDRSDVWAPAGMIGKQVGSTDLVITITIWCWETPTGPFHGVTLLGVDHSNDCPLQSRVVQPTKALRVLPMLGKSARGIVTNSIANMGAQASAAMSYLGQAIGAKPLA